MLNEIAPLEYSVLFKSIAAHNNERNEMLENFLFLFFLLDMKSHWRVSTRDLVDSWVSCIGKLKIDGINQMNENTGNIDQSGIYITNS